MHRAFLLAALIASSSAFAADRISDGRAFGIGPTLVFAVVPDAQLRQVVESAVASIERASRANWTAEQKLSSIHQTLAKVQTYRKTAWSRSPATEHKLDLMINPYESFPKPEEFRQKNCPTYMSTLKLDWEPTATNAPTIKGVKRAWDNLKHICM
jgi:hypothetical protein